MFKAAPVSEASADRLINNPSPFQSLSKDLPAGLVVFLVALPLCLGISLASGAPLPAGVIAGIVGGVVVAWLSGSALSVSGPAAGLTAITLAATGLILILKQIPHFLGVDADYLEDITFLQFDGQNTFSELEIAIENFRPGPALIGLVCLGGLFWDRVLSQRSRVAKLVPGALVVVAIMLNVLFGAVVPTFSVRAERMVHLPNSTSWLDVTRLVSVPDWAAFSRPATYGVAFTIAIVASLETLLSVKAVEKLDPHKCNTPTNRERLAQGAGNLISGLLGGLPMTAVIVRSSANIGAAGQTRMSAYYLSRPADQADGPMRLRLSQQPSVLNKASIREVIHDLPSTLASLSTAPMRLSLITTCSKPLRTFASRPRSATSAWSYTTSRRCGGSATNTLKTMANQ